MREFVVEALNILHLTELWEIVPRQDLVVTVLVLLFGIGTCFLGYRLRNLWFAMLCLVAGTYGGWYLFSTQGLDRNMAIALSLLFAVLMVFTYRIGQFGVIFLMGYYLTVNLFAVPYPYWLIVCVILAVGALVLSRWTISLVTAALGAVFAGNYVLGFIPSLGVKQITAFASRIQDGSWEKWCFWGVLFLLGFLCQANLPGYPPLIRKRARE